MSLRVDGHPPHQTLSVVSSVSGTFVAITQACTGRYCLLLLGFISLIDLVHA